MPPDSEDSLREHRESANPHISDRVGETVPLEVFQALPKTDLHVHLDGSLRLGTILDIAQKQGIRLPAEDEAGLADAIGCGKNFGSLVDYLRGFDITIPVMQTADALECVNARRHFRRIYCRVPLSRPGRAGR